MCMDRLLGEETAWACSSHAFAYAEFFLDRIEAFFSNMLVMYLFLHQTPMSLDLL